MQLVERQVDLPPLLDEARHAERLAVDLEASGMFTYRAHICTVQLAWRGIAATIGSPPAGAADADTTIVVVDALALPVAGLAPLLGAEGPVKIVHDVAFDARLLAEAGVFLGNVHDTAVAARMLGRAATGLASLLESELALHITKDRQQDDWRIRPLEGEMLAYLAADVAHLAQLEAALWAEVTARGIGAEVLEETRYRIETAATAAREPRVVPPYARVKGVDRLSAGERAALRPLAELREREAERRDVPPHRVMPGDTLVAIARARPKTGAEIAKMRGVSTASAAARALVDELARAVNAAPGDVPETERALFERPRRGAAEQRAQREREQRLMAWRKSEAKRREVDEQVVLPGHCLKDAAHGAVETVEDLAAVGGIGAFRVARDGDAIVHALRGEGDTA
ncbi:MAG TPA: ribonuclease D [Polyangiaceae bacterium]|jgi:ribonuclease D